MSDRLRLSAFVSQRPFTAGYNLPRTPKSARLCRLPLGFAAFTARLCRLLPTGRKNVVASLVVHFRLHVRQAQVVCVRVPATIHRRVQLTQNSQVRSALPLAARLCRFHRSALPLATERTQESVATERRFSSTARRGKSTKGRKNAGGDLSLKSCINVRGLVLLAGWLGRFRT